MLQLTAVCAKRQQQQQQQLLIASSPEPDWLPVVFGMIALKAAIRPWPPSPLLLEDSLPQLLPKSLLKVLLIPLGVAWPCGEAGVASAARC
jgi:hypothetical protein